MQLLNFVQKVFHKSDDVTTDGLSYRFETVFAKKLNNTDHKHLYLSLCACHSKAKKLFPS